LNRPRAGDRREPPLVGLTGAIAAGKSEALAALARLGAATLSTDEVVAELLAEPEVVDQVSARLGPQAAPSGIVDREAVARAVFASSDDREWLEGVLWPRVGERIADWYERQAAVSPRPRAAVVEVPLLFESGMESAFDATIAVIAADRVRRERVAGRNHAAVEQRSQRQLSQEEKAERADHVVVNDGDLDDLERALSDLLAVLGSAG
jgi:dephospho-CoA kinase